MVPKGFQTVLQWTILIAFMGKISHGYKTLYLGDSPSTRYKLGVSRYSGSAIILKATRESSKPLPGEYEFIVEPPTELFETYGLIGTIQKLDLRREGPKCKDKLEIRTDVGYTEKIIFDDCHSNSWTFELDTFSRDRSFIIKMFIGRGACNETFNGLELTITAVSRCGYGGGFKKSSEYYCGYNKCIYDGLRCDGRDNCGDNNDERKCSIVIFSSWKIGITVVFLLAGAVIMGVAIHRCRKRRTPNFAFHTYHTNPQQQYNNPEGNLYPVQQVVVPQVPQTTQVPQAWTTPYSHQAPLIPEYADPPPPYFNVANTTNTRY